jgi:N-acetyl-anhydromuramyl-L-alanine amidase AmpD
MHITFSLLDINNHCVFDGLSIGQRISQNGKEHLWDDRPAGAVTDTIVIHSMHAMPLAPESPLETAALLAILCVHDVSCHYLIQRSGEIFQLVPDEKRAWHCGGSIMPYPDLRMGANAFSIGIELASLPAQPFANEQYEALEKLCRSCIARYPSISSVLGHEHIAGSESVARQLRFDEKLDPGPAFVWSGVKDILKA